MNKEIVYIVDDDQAMRQSLQWLMSSVSLATECFPTAQAFLDTLKLEQPSCLLLDMRMEGMSGLALQECLKPHSEALPTIFLTGHGDVPSAVHALKNGAFDYIEKPFSNQMLIERIYEALDKSRSEFQKIKTHLEIEEKLSSLTSRERDVFNLLSMGYINKSIAHQLNVSEGTVERHRSRIMDKLRVTSLADLISLGTVKNQ